MAGPMKRTVDELPVYAKVRLAREVAGLLDAQLIGGTVGKLIRRMIAVEADRARDEYAPCMRRLRYRVRVGRPARHVRLRCTHPMPTRRHRLPVVRPLPATPPTRSPHDRQEHTTMTKLASSLPTPRHNGLNSIEQQLINKPDDTQIVVVALDCKSTTTNMDTGETEATARILQIEPMRDDKDVKAARRLLSRAEQDRTGGLQFDPDTGEIIGDA